MKHIEIPGHLFVGLGAADSPPQVALRNGPVLVQVRRLVSNRFWLALRTVDDPKTPFSQLTVCEDEASARGKISEHHFSCLVCITAHQPDDAREAQHVDQDGIVCEIGAMGRKQPNIFLGDEVEMFHTFWNMLAEASGVRPSAVS